MKMICATRLPMWNFVKNRAELGYWNGCGWIGDSTEAVMSEFGDKLTYVQAVCPKCKTKLVLFKTNKKAIDELGAVV